MGRRKGWVWVQMGKGCCIWGLKWGWGREWGWDREGGGVVGGLGGVSASTHPISPQTYGSGMRPPPSSLAGPGMPTMNM